MDPLAAEGGLPRPIYPEAQEKADGDLCLLGKDPLTCYDGFEIVFKETPGVL